MRAMETLTGLVYLNRILPTPARLRQVPDLSRHSSGPGLAVGRLVDWSELEIQV
jgi:hypothetical protein